MTKRKTKLILMAILCLVSAFLLSTFLALNPKIKSKENVSADDLYVANVQLVNTQVSKNGDDYSNATNVEPTKLQTINNGDTVVIDNINAYNETDWTNAIETQAIKFEMGTSGSTKLAYLSISATLNGQTLVIPNPDTNNKFSFMFFGLKEELLTSDTNNNTSRIAETVGKVVFNYSYREESPNVPVETLRTGSFTFNILTTPYLSTSNVGGEEVNAWDYKNCFTKNTGSNASEVPMVAGTRADNELYFNYNNFTSSTDSKLVLPKVKYDATKYSLSYTRRVYNSLETVTSSMSVTKFTDKTSANISFVSTLNGKTETFNYQIDDLNTNPIVTLVFDDIGVYEFSLTPHTRIDDITFMPVTNAKPALLGAQKNVKNVTIFGYQLKYADDVTGSNELKNEDLGLFADITQNNYTLVNNGLTTTNLNNVNFFKDNEIRLIPSTNQAPLWFDYIGTLDTNINNLSKYYYFANTATLDFNNLNNSGTEKPYKKGTYFMDAGLYIVELNYRLNEFSETTAFRQYFAFEISNTVPEANIHLLDGTSLHNDGYTNQKVALTWDESNPFNAKIKAEYDRYNFNNELVDMAQPMYKFGTDNQTILTKNGKYKVRLYYGRFGLSFTEWEFTIDTDPISNLQIAIKDSMGQTTTTLDALNCDILNNKFTLKWASKASGAMTYIEHQQMLLVKDDAYIVNQLSNLVDLTPQNASTKIYALKNGYITSSLSSSIIYENVQDFAVEQYALHFFKIYDEAGNELYYAVLLDNTNPAFLFDPPIENYFNIIKDTTTIVWGDYKGIQFDAPSDDEDSLYKSMLDNNKLPEIVDVEKGLLKIAFNQINVQFAEQQSDLSQSSLVVTSPSVQIVIDNTAKNITSYASQISVDSGLVVTNASKNLTPIISTTLTDTYFFNFELFDDSTKALSNLKTGYSSTQVEVNLDASQVLAYTNEEQTIRLYDGSATNRDKLHLDFFLERDDFVVESLKVDYYPIAMDKSLASYPYLDRVTHTQDLLKTAEYQTTTKKWKTDYFNLSFSSQLQRDVTQAGKYVVTRVYEYDPTLFTSENDPKRTKQYTFYVDRFNIIQKITVDYPILVDNEETFTRTVGEYIKLTLGGAQQSADFNDLLLSTTTNSNGSKNVILVTDLLPVNTVVPVNKYSLFDSQPNNGVYSTINSFNLNLDVYYNSSGAQDEKSYVHLFNITANDASQIVQNLLNVDPTKMKNAGYYKFVLTDNAGYVEFDANGTTTKNNSPNSFEFRIQLKKELPKGTYYGKPNADKTEKEIPEIQGESGTLVASSSEDELKFVFTETTDIYKAKINSLNVKVERRAKGATSFQQFVIVNFQEQEHKVDGQIIYPFDYPSSTSITSLNDAKGFKEKIPKRDSLGNLIYTGNGEERELVYKTDSAGNYIYKYSIILPTKTLSGEYYEGEYRITLEYNGDESFYYSYDNTICYFRNSMNVVLDHTAPNFNLLRLVYQDKYLPATSADPNVVSKQDIIEYLKNNLDTNPSKKEQVRLFLREYAFALPSDFVFRKATNNGFSVEQYDDYTYPEHDTQSIYVRKYNKYSKTADDTEQSYINSDPEYGDPTKQNFEVADPVYHALSHAEWTTTTNPFYDTISGATNKAEGYGEEGYYEIIEIDQAGNQRIYTVFLKRSDTNLTFKDISSSPNDEIIKNANKDNPSLSLGYEFVLKEISNLDTWTKITLYDATGGKIFLQEFTITPTTNIQSLLDSLNLHISDDTKHLNTGAKYEIEYLNRFGQNFTISIQRPGETLKHTIIESSLSFNFILPTSTNSTWIVELKVEQFDPVTKTLYELTHDLNGPILKQASSSTDFSGVKYSFNAGEYYFTMIDNFGRGESHPIHYIFNIIDAKDLTFNSTVIGNTTAGSVKFDYQTLLYEMELYVDGKLVEDLTMYENISFEQNQSTNINTFYFSPKQNELNIYEIKLNYNTNGLNISNIEPIIYRFTIDTTMPMFELTDSNGNNMNYLLNSLEASTSKEIFINWSGESNYPITVMLKKDNAQAIAIEKGYSIYLLGTYTLTMTNTLGNTISHTFKISQNAAVLYDVYAGGQKIEASINSALFAKSWVQNDEEYDLREYVKVYASISPLSVIANEKKDLQTKLIYVYNLNNVYNLKLYQIFGSSSLYYNEYIALIQINEEILNISSFLLGEIQEVMSAAGGHSTTFYSKDVYATWLKSFKLDVMGFENLEFTDFIKVDLYYNNIFVSSFDTDSLHFTESGEYKLYFYDIAGHKYQFYNGLSVRNYYTIDLLNSVSFKVNDAEPIDYAIFNDSVTFVPTNTSRYDPGTFSMTATLNNVEFSLKEIKQNGIYTFNRYGSYKIKMSASINNTPISSEYNFTILSDDEANARFSFNKHEKFEIVSVLKEGVDITEELKTEQQTTKLMDLNFSTSDQDNGRYQVKVVVKQSELKPTLSFEFNFWINSAELNLMPSIPFGKSTTAKIKIKLNKYAIYQELGNTILTISGMDNIVINSQTAVNQISTITLSENRTYLIQAYTESGRLLASYVITKNEPLNTVAIIVIIGAVALAVSLTVMFIVFRTRMKVR